MRKLNKELEEGSVNTYDDFLLKMEGIVQLPAVYQEKLLEKLKNCLPTKFDEPIQNEDLQDVFEQQLFEKFQHSLPANFAQLSEDEKQQLFSEFMQQNLPAGLQQNSPSNCQMQQQDHCQMQQNNFQIQQQDSSNMSQIPHRNFNDDENYLDPNLFQEVNLADVERMRNVNHRASRRNTTMANESLD